MTSQFENRAIVTNPKEGQFLERTVADLALMHGFERETIVAIRLALQEAVSNAMIHGNRRDRSQSVLVEYSVDDEKVTLRVTDQGSGFDPESLPDPTSPERLTVPGGRGLMLIRELMTGVEVIPPGNQIEFWKSKAD